MGLIEALATFAHMTVQDIWLAIAVGVGLLGAAAGLAIVLLRPKTGRRPRR